MTIRRANITAAAATAFLLAACGGGGSDGEPPLARDVAGEWTFPCRESGGEWRAEVLSFDGQTGAVTHARLRHGTPDCSDQGVATAEERGTYSVGPAVACASGSAAGCAPVDFAWETGEKGYALFSVDEAPDPDVLWLSDVASDPAQRAGDVDPSRELRRISFPGVYGQAILDVYLVDGGYDGTPPAPAAGYTVLPADLNHGSGGHYIWLYYRMGRADGADGTPLGEVYTVDQHGGETPRKGGTLLPVNLNAGPIVGHELWLYKVRATDAVMRCLVLANATSGGSTYGPPAAAGQYDVTWVQELEPDAIKALPPYPPDAQDLNEGEGIWTDYLYLGYCPDR